MTTAATYVRRRCCEAGLCSAGAPDGIVQVNEPAAMPAGLSMWSGPVEASVELAAPLPRDRRVAAHEAGHAVLAHGFGWSVALVRIDVPARVEYVATPTTAAQRTAVALAGDHAADWLARTVYRPHDHELLPFLQALRELKHGNCDRCSAMLHVCAIVGASADDATFLRTYRKIERQVIDMIQTPRVWRAVSDLAEQLMIRGAITGDDAHDIMERHLPHGSLNF